MFASTRPLIHATLRLTRRNNEGILTREEKKELRKKPGKHELRFLSYMGERGLLQYARCVDIRDPAIYTPETLLPHLHHFQSLDRVHSLTIAHYNAVKWANHYKTCFVHLYPTLTSLALCNPFGSHEAVMQFALQFPNLEDLSIVVLQEGGMLDLTTTAIDQSPPLCGHLRLVGYNTIARWPGSTDLTHDLPNGFNFRTVELEAYSGDRVQQVLQSCAHTLEDLTIVLDETGFHQLEELVFTELTVFRRLILRMAFLQVCTLYQDAICAALWTVTSPSFCELVLEIDRLPSSFNGPSSRHWGIWDQTDNFLNEQFATRGNFRFTIRTSELHDQGTFQRHTKEIFPLLERMGRIRFETSDSIERPSSLP